MSTQPKNSSMAVLLTLLNNCDKDGFFAMLNVVPVDRVDLAAVFRCAVEQYKGYSDTLMEIAAHPRDWMAAAPQNSVGRG